MNLILFYHNLGLIDAAEFVYLALARAKNATSLHRVLVVEDLQNALVPLALGKEVFLIFFFVTRIVDFESVADHRIEHESIGRNVRFGI